MRVWTLVVGVIVAFAPAVAAQNAGVGVKAGVNFANVQFEGSGVDVNFDRRTGFVGGLFAVWPLGGRIALQPEVLFSQKGAEFNEEGFSTKIHLDYLEVPVLLRVSSTPSAGTSFNVFGGPSLGFRLRARGDMDGEDEDISDDVEPFDFGVAIGAGLEFGRFVLDGRYTWGLRNLNKDDTIEVQTKNRVFAVMAGFRF